MSKSQPGTRKEEQEAREGICRNFSGRREQGHLRN